jgi:hypothetical protein
MRQPRYEISVVNHRDEVGVLYLEQEVKTSEAVRRIYTWVLPLIMEEPPNKVTLLNQSKSTENLLSLATMPKPAEPEQPPKEPQSPKLEAQPRKESLRSEAQPSTQSQPPNSPVSSFII